MQRSAGGMRWTTPLRTVSRFSLILPTQQRRNSGLIKKERPLYVNIHHIYKYIYPNPICDFPLFICGGYTIHLDSSLEKDAATNDYCISIAKEELLMYQKELGVD